MTAKKRGRKPLNRASEDVRRPHSVRASDCEFKAMKDFLVLFRQDADKCYLFLQIPPATPLPAATSSTSSTSSAPVPAPPPVPDKLTAEQQIAFDALMAGQNVFLSGGAGTGKTFVLDRFIAACQKARKTVLRMAPTGIAARLIGGSTIHRAIKAKTTIIGPDDFKAKDYANKIGQKRYEILAQADVIVVDEISMCRSDLFAYLAKIILAEGQPHLPFRFNVPEGKPRAPEDLKPIQHPIQVVLCGDFAQLPPIIGSQPNQDVWEECYPENQDGWAFLTAQWKDLGLKTYDLKTVIRQSNPEFSEALNKIRRGDASGIDYINTNYAKALQKDCMTICTRKIEVTRINKERYAALDHTEQKTYVLQEEGEVTDDDKSSIAARLRLCPGTRVLFMANDNEVTPPRYSNGSFGTVTATKMDSILVELDDGLEVEVKRKEWKVTRPRLVEDKETGEKKVEEVVVGKFSQIPVVWGWAITIHKSQGQSYESVNIDPSNTFADGQLYVALSRCKDIHQMHLSRPLVPSDVMTSKAVQRFYGWDEAENPSENPPEEQPEDNSTEEEVTENE